MKYLVAFLLSAVSCFAGIQTGPNAGSGGGGGSSNPFALGLSNSTLPSPIYWTNRAGAALESDVPIIVQTNYIADTAISIFAPSAHSSGDGLVFPLFGTNFVAGAGNVMDSYVNANGITETNYLQDQFAMFISTVPRQSGTSNQVSGIGNIAQGCGQIFMNAQPFTLNGFYQGKENTAIFFNPTNYTIKFLVPQTASNYDGMGDNFAKCTLTIDEPNNRVIVSNILGVSSNIFMGTGNPNMSGGAGSALFTNAGGAGILYLDPTTISPLGALTVTNLFIGAGNLVNAINFASSTYIQRTGGGGDLSFFDNSGEYLRIGGTGGDNFLSMRTTGAIGWNTDGAGSIGSAGASGIGRPLNVFVKNTNNAAVLVIGNITNTTSFTYVFTNWVDGATYTNQTGRPILICVPYKLAVAAVSGVANYYIATGGVVTTGTPVASISTTALSIAMGYTNNINYLITNSQTFVLTNLSTGVGNSGAVLPGGYYIVY